MTLITHSIPPVSGKAKSLVIFLHGYGANGADLLSIGGQWKRALPDTAFIAPDAPEVCEAFAGGFQWFSIRAAEIIDAGTFERKALIQKPARILDAYIDEQLKHWNVPESRLVVAGFSQGAMMAMYTMPRRKSPCAGVIGWSGMLLDAPGLKGAAKMPVLAIHGDADEVVPPDSLGDVEKGFEAAGFDVETIMRPGLGHGIDEFSLMRSFEFIQEVVDKPVNSNT
jgi:phospholipase/carboxylesterase